MGNDSSQNYAGQQVQDMASDFDASQQYNYDYQNQQYDGQNYGYDQQDYSHYQYDQYGYNQQDYNYGSYGTGEGQEDYSQIYQDHYRPSAKKPSVSGGQIPSQGLSDGFLNSYRDLVLLKTYEYPDILVCEPTSKGSGPSKYVLYKVVGSDHIGEFEIWRRYSHFDLFREILLQRFMGLYIPPIPPKQKIGNNEQSFVDERKESLDTFMKDITFLPYLYESAEFQVFIRPQIGNVEKALKSLPPMTTDDHLTRLRQLIPINESVNEYKYKTCNEVIGEFQKEAKDLIGLLDQFKAQIKLIMPLKSQEMSFYKYFIDFASKYEDTNAKYMQNLGANRSDLNISILTGEGTSLDMKEKLQNMAMDMKNPFRHIKDWIKGEVKKIHSLLESIQRVQNLEVIKRNTLKKVNDAKVTSSKLETGKFTFTGILKSQEAKQVEQQKILDQIGQAEKDILNYDILRNYLLIYLADIAIPFFKNQKMKIYLNAINNFCAEEIFNAEQNLNAWTEFQRIVKGVHFY